MSISLIERLFPQSKNFAGVSALSTGRLYERTSSQSILRQDSKHCADLLQRSSHGEEVVAICFVRNLHVSSRPSSLT